MRPSGFPRITQDPMPQSVEKGRDFVVRCKATGEPEPTIHWFKDGVPVNMSSSRYKLHDRPNRGESRRTTGPAEVSCAARPAQQR